MRVLRPSLCVSCGFVVWGCATAPPPPPPPPPPPAPVVEEPPPPPPRPIGNASVRVIHASPDSMASRVAVWMDDGQAPIIDALQYRTAEGYRPLPAGPHTVAARVPGATAASPPVLTWTTPDFQVDHAYTVIAHGIASDPSGPAVSFAPEEDQTDAPDAAQATVRLFHAVVRAPSVELCRDAASVFSGAVAYGQWAAGSAGRYATTAPGAVTLTVRASGATPCTGRRLGAARVQLAPGTRTSLVLVGRVSSAADRVPLEVLACRDLPLEGPSQCAPSPLR